MHTFFDSLRASTQLLTYTVVIGCGAVYLLLAWILGHFGADHDVEHDTGSDMDHADSGHATVSIFSPKIIALFAVGLGAGGCLSTLNGYGPFGSALWGLGTGAALGGLMLFGMRLLYSQQASSSIDVSSSLGKIGTVTVDILPGSTGEIGITVSGQYTTFFARAHDNQTMIHRGRVAKVTSVSGSILVVEETN